MSDFRTLPRRPAMTAVLACALAFWLSCAVAYSLARIFAISTCFAAALASGGALCTLALLLALRAVPKQAIVAMALCCGCFLGIADAASVHGAAARLADERVVEGVLVLVEDASPGTYGWSAPCLLADGNGTRYRLSASFPDDAMRLNGQAFEVRASVSCAPFAEGTYYWDRALCGKAKVISCKKIPRPLIVAAPIALRERALAFIGSGDSPRALLQALVCGYRANMRETDEYAAFQASGLAHMIAVSGAHLVIVIGFVSALLKALRCPRRVSICLLVAAMSAYTIMAGMPLSCMRAAVMSSVGVLALWGKRRPSALNSLGITLFALVGFQPHCSVSPSLALSALATLGIVLFAPLFQRAIEDAFPLKAAVLTGPLALCMASAVLAQLYACSLFGKLPLISPLANVICAPLFPLCCAGGLAASVVRPFCPPAAQVALGFSLLGARLLCAIVNALSGLPYSCVPVAISAPAALAVSAMAALCLWLLWEKLLDKRVAASIAAVTVAITLAFWLWPKGDRIVMLDVGQGDSFLLQSSGQSLLIDTGNQDARLLAGLARCRTAHLDAVLVTHADDDHCGSLDALEKGLDVADILVAADMTTCEDESCVNLMEQAQKTAQQVVPVDVGDVVHVGRFSVEILWPHVFADNGGNEDSVIAYVTYDRDDDGQPEASALFTGDAESDVLEKALGDRHLGGIDILKVGHHGSGGSISQSLAQQLSPKVALIGVGANNRYGHPTQETLDILDNAGCTVLRSDIDATTGIQMTSNGMRIYSL